MKTTTSNSMKPVIFNPLKNYGIIVPCYNEQKRFPFQQFLSFAKKHPQVLICVILKTSFQHKQCGAKIFQRDLVPFLFSQPFITAWLFNVEIFLRLQKKFGKTTLQKRVLELMLMRWTGVGDSILKLKHATKIPVQSLKLHYQYNVAKSLMPNPATPCLIQKAILR